MFPNVILLGWIQRGRYSGANKAVLEKEEEGHFYWDTLYSATRGGFKMHTSSVELFPSVAKTSWTHF